MKCTNLHKLINGLQWKKETNDRANEREHMNINNSELTAIR